MIIDQIRMCVDRPIPATKLAEAQATAIRENPANGLRPLEVAGLKQYFWQSGRTLRVRFLDGDPTVQGRVETAAQEWSKYANIRFEFGSDPEAEIRISFLQPGAWSYVGTYALNIPINEPTMNFGWLTADTSLDELSRVVLHEFGHALGFIHEHQHPENGIPWDIEKVYEFYALTQGWNREMVYTNVLYAYDQTVTQYSQFDPYSIMLYPISNELTIGDWEIPWMNSTLSETDKAFVATVYPRQTAFDAAVLAANGKLYFFQGDRYFRLTPGVELDNGFPRTIAGHWRGLPDSFSRDLDTVLALADGKLYFLKGEQVLRYTLGAGVDEGYPRRIVDEWPEGNFAAPTIPATSSARAEDLSTVQRRKQPAGERHFQTRPATARSSAETYDLVFEGGGAKGIAFTGAITGLLERGHRFGRLMGTSAGAMMATFTAAGYDGLEMRRALEERDEQGRPRMATFLSPPAPFPPEVIEQSILRQWLRSADLPLLPEFIEGFLDDRLMQALLKTPVNRRLFSFVEQGGWYGAENLIAYLQSKLSEGTYYGRPREFGEMTLGEFYLATETDLSLLASDTTRGRLLVLNHRTAPDCPLVWAVRMSTSVPLLWQEVIWQAEWGAYRGIDIAGNAVVDGGILSSFPIELFITEQPMWLEIMGPKQSDRLIGMLIDEQLEVPGAPPGPAWDPEDVLYQHKPLRRMAQLVDTMMRARDKMVIDQYAGYVLRLPAKGYGTIDFSMSASRRAALVAAGRAAMLAYLDRQASQMPASMLAAERADFTARADELAARILGDDESVG